MGCIWDVEMEVVIGGREWVYMGVEMGYIWGWRWGIYGGGDECISPYTPPSPPHPPYTPMVEMGVMWGGDRVKMRLYMGD